MITVKELLMKKIPVYVVIISVVLICTVVVGCRWVPTSYTTSEDQKNLVRQNTLLQIELYRRYKEMDPNKRDQFMIENIKYAISMEDIICGDTSETSKLFEATIKSSDISDTSTK